LDPTPPPSSSSSAYAILKMGETVGANHAFIE
jgi:hypothetical protein